MCSASPSDMLDAVQHYVFTWRHLNKKFQNDSRVRVLYPTNSSSVLSLNYLGVLDAMVFCDVASDTSLRDFIVPTPLVTTNISLRLIGRIALSLVTFYRANLQSLLQLST